MYTLSNYVNNVELLMLPWQESHHNITITCGSCTTYIIINISTSTYDRGVSNTTEKRTRVYLNNTDINSNENDDTFYDKNNDNGQVIITMVWVVMIYTGI